jgi:tRNA pseudouridine32 synthase/23S rRNA pseudouridine746 synthase
MQVYKTIISKHFSEKTKLGEVLQKISKFDLSLVTDAANKGAVWLQKNSKGKILRARSINLELSPLDTVTFFYDPRVLSLPELKHADCLFENKNYGIWLKAAGIVPQGTQTGDHSSLLRFVEKHKKKEVYLIHRLDRETEGLMVIGYSSEAAHKLSDLFQKNKVQKTYEAIVLGEMEEGSRETISHQLDDKEAITHLEVLESRKGVSHLRLNIETGRLHQIRRHLEIIGHPVMGDPKYGTRNKNRSGLQLLAKSLSFEDPWERKVQSWVLENSLSI